MVLATPHRIDRSRREVAFESGPPAVGVGETLKPRAFEGVTVRRARAVLDATRAQDTRTIRVRSLVRSSRVTRRAETHARASIEA
jgi:hypothetical protein